MLTEHQIQALRQIREGRQFTDDTHATGLVEGGYATRNDGRYQLTDMGEQELRLLPNYGEALVDILIPGAGTDQAVQNTAAEDHQSVPPRKD